MSLSNTAIPKYYGEYRDQVLNNEIPVNKEISLEMNRIDQLIEHPGYYYDDEAVEGYIRFCETELTLTDGSPMHLLQSFKLWAEQVFGWYYFVRRNVYDPVIGDYQEKIVKQRLIKKQYLIVARGAAKSIYESTIQNYFLNIDTSTSHQITTAPTMKQADEVMAPIRTSITRARGPLFKFLTYGSQNNTTGSKMSRPKLLSTKLGIVNLLTGSLLEVRPMTIDKLQGLRVKCATVDEWLSGDLKEDPIGAIEQGAAKEQSATEQDDYLILAVSSEGTVRNASGDTIKMELLEILKGEYYAPHISIWYYRLDEIDEINDPSLWIKANPNLGITVTYETYQLDVERAEKAPASRNDILAKRFGIPMEGYTYYFTYEETLPHRPRDYWQMPAALGADLSQGDDFCAFTFMFPLGADAFGIITRSYITEITYSKLPLAIKNKYNEFIAEGSLVVMPGAVLDMDGPSGVYEDLDEFIQQREYEVVCLGYDVYNSKEFIDRWVADNGDFGVIKVPQGARTESVPLGELKTLAEERLLEFHQQLMMYAMGNAVTIEDNNGNRKLLKKRHAQKIDNVAAMMDAFIAFKAHKEAFE